METESNGKWRLLLSEPADGASNMAVDEAILDAVIAGNASPTLRFFSWNPATLSLGYAQPVADADEGALAEFGWGLVRRPTGGRAILHTDELTYSIIGPDDMPVMAGGVLASYRRLSRGLLAGLRKLGAEAEIAPERASRNRKGAVCFETPSDYEITHNGRKLIGSAQARRPGGVLQHGSLPLAGDLARILSVLKRSGSDAERVHARATTLQEALGRIVSWGEASQAMQNGFEEEFGFIFARGILSPGETAQAQNLVLEKYGNARWNRRI